MTKKIEDKDLDKAAGGGDPAGSIFERRPPNKPQAPSSGSGSTGGNQWTDVAENTPEP